MIYREQGGVSLLGISLEKNSAFFYAYLGVALTAIIVGLYFFFKFLMREDPNKNKRYMKKSSKKSKKKR